MLLDDATEYQLGRLVCAKLDEGEADSEVVATLDQMPAVSASDAEAIDYWSAADLCG